MENPFRIILHTWYPETSDKEYEEIYKNIGFEHIEDAVDYLKENIEKILSEFPVYGITIKPK